MRWLTLPLHSERDVVAATGRLRAWAEALGLETLARTRVVTLGGELARAAAASADGSIEFGWGADPDASFCSIEAPDAALAAAAEAQVGERGVHVDDADVAVHREAGRARVRIDARSRAPREAIQRAVADAPEASAADILQAQNLEMARMLGTLRDREAELVRALDEARQSANEAAGHALKLAELSKRKDELLAIASHDIRSPLAASKGALDLLEPTLAAISDDQRHLIAVARRGCDAVVHLVANLLSSALIELPDDDPDDPTAFELVSTTREVIELSAVHARQKGAQLTFDAPAGGVSPVRGDPVWGRQIVANLVNNALKYAPKLGGRIDVRVADEGAEVVFVVEDDGVGIPADKVDRVFDRLNKLRPRGTAGERGTGIGLYVTKQLVERLGGRITVSARLPTGTRFEVRLPIAVRAASNQVHAAPPA